MKKCYFIYYLIAVGIWILNSSLINSFNRNVEVYPVNSSFTLLYIDNSHSSSNPGLSRNMIEFLYSVADSIKSAPFLFYLSNGNNPVWTKNNSQLKEQLLKLSDNYSSFPDCIFDKKNMVKIIRDEKMSQYKTLNLYFIITESYLKELINENEKPAYLTKFFPIELLTLTEEANVIVNICYTPRTNNVKTDEFNELEKHLNFYTKGNYKTQGNYQANIKYNIILK